MRLLQTKSCELFEASDVPVPFPSYAILSHTWISSKDEITYQDMKTRTGDIKNNVYKQKGWSKLKDFCNRAASDGWEWAWMDTCCIDKTNPADTQEAINAMFRWYQNAGICYAYLADVDISKASHIIPHLENADIEGAVSSNHDVSANWLVRKAVEDNFITAKWFTRGWTLQELLAPHYLIFVDHTWRLIGTRESWALEIEKASKIEACYLTAFNPTDFTSCSIAMRFSWASGRETTVEEDESYSLLGLFGISLPLIYGEGGRQAFNRLQRQLIQVYPDDSVFAWKDPLPISHDSRLGRGILARSVKDFWDASKITSRQYGNAYSMTNRGLEITSKCWRQRNNPNNALIRLNCSTGSTNIAERRQIGIHLIHDPVADVYHRNLVHELEEMGKLNNNHWEEELNREPIVIHADNYSDPLAPPPIFVIECPERVKIVAKYAATFKSSLANHRIQPLGTMNKTLVNGTRIEELSIEPNNVVFINIELEEKGNKIELDVIISLTQNGFPHVGILGRGKDSWKRLGDPLDEDEGNETYNTLAAHIHRTLPSDPTYPLAATANEGNLKFSTHVLPKPPRKGSRTVGGQLALREYMLEISVSRFEASLGRSGGPRSSEGPESAAKRQRISQTKGDVNWRHT